MTAREDTRRGPLSWSASMACLLDALFTRRAAGAARSSPAASRPTGAGAARSARKEILRVGLRETLLRNGIPAGWIGIETVRTADRKGLEGLHARLTIHRWDERLLESLVALEADFLRRLARLDPAQAQWMRGVSWQFALPDGAGCPPLPPAASWTADPRPRRIEAVAPAVASGTPVIAGPVLVHEMPDEAGRRRSIAPTVPAALLHEPPSAQSRPGA